jgi:hypothetical protein
MDFHDETPRESRASTEGAALPDVTAGAPGRPAPGASAG